MKKDTKKRIKTVQSTQMNIPLRDITGGAVITKDGKCVRIIEVLPVPFFLKRISQQNKIGDSFSTLLKTAPDSLHIKSVSVPSDLSHQIESIKERIATEENKYCRKMGKEYMETLVSGQNNGVTRRFFISFYQNTRVAGITRAELPEVIYKLKSEENRLIASLASCGNEVVTVDSVSQQEELLKLFYMLYHRSSFISKPYSLHEREIYKKYFDAYGQKDFYVPPTDLIAPNKISYTNNRYLIVDDTYYSFLYIPSYGYNPDVVTGWLDNFVNSFNGVDVDVFLRKNKDEQKLKKSIQRSIGHSRYSMNESADVTDSYADASNRLNAAFYLKCGLASGQDLYDMSVIITVTGQSPEEVDYKKEELKKNARAIDVTLKENFFECEQTFNAVLPSSAYNEKLMSKMRRNVLTDGAASMYPFTTFQLLDSEGLYIADDNNGSPAIIDLFNRQRFNNPHMFICGETGAGKSVALMLIALRARVKGMPVFIIAPEKEHEFERLCSNIGGQFISIGAGSPHRINIMEIFRRDESAEEIKRLLDGASSYEKTSYLEEKIATLMEFIQLYVTDITIEEKQLLSEAIENTYRKKGITKDNNSLWGDKERSRYKKMPILSDLTEELLSMPETVRLGRIIRGLSSGNGSHFNGETNIDISNDFFVLGLEHNTKEMLGLSIYMAMDYCWSKIKEDRTKNKFLIIDEWWRMAYNAIAADKTLEISKIARAYSCSMVLATQQMSDILAIEDGKYGKAVLNNCATKILMSMKENDAYSVRDMIGLTNSECETILHFKAGEGLLIASDNRMELRFNPSETEKLLTFTDNETLKKFADLKQQEEAKEKEMLKKHGIVRDISSVRFVSLEEWEDTLTQKKGGLNP